MAKDKLTIPDTIHVGFNARSDTYTGKLGYVGLAKRLDSL